MCPLRGRFREFYPGTIPNAAFRSPVLNKWKMRGEGFWRKFPEAASRTKHPRDVSTPPQPPCSLGVAQHHKERMREWMMPPPGHKGRGFHPEKSPAVWWLKNLRY